MQMGRGLGPWAFGPGTRHEVTEDSWSMVTGRPSLEANTVLLHGSDPERVPQVMNGLTKEGIAGLVFLAGDAATHGDRAPEGWVEIGALPAMHADLTEASLPCDERVRLAHEGDVEALMNGFGMGDPADEHLLEPLRRPSPAMQMWVLEQDGALISTATAAFVDDTVSLWAMGTAPEHRRRGYGSALLSTVLAEAIRRGARTGLLAATPDGQLLYEHAGWQTFENWQIYTNASSLQSEG